MLWVSRVLACLPCFLLVLSSCVQSPLGPLSSHAGVRVPTLIGGMVVGNDGITPVADVVVRVGSRSTSTDENGMYILQTEVSPSYVCVVAEREGWRVTSDCVVPTANGITVVNLIMPTNAAPTEIPSSGQLKLTTGPVLVSAPSIAFVYLSGSSPNESKVMGMVDFVAPGMVRPSAAKIPGNGHGVDKDGVDVLLTNYGCVSLDFRDVHGRTLQIAQHAPVMLSWKGFALAPQDGGNNPSLWRFDEVSGLWKEESALAVSDNGISGLVRRTGMWAFCVARRSDAAVRLRFRVVQNTTGDVRIPITGEAVFVGQHRAVSGREGIAEIDVPDVDSTSVYLRHPNITGFEQVLRIEPRRYRDSIIQIESMIVQFQGTGSVVDCAGKPVNGVMQTFNTGESSCVGVYDGVYRNQSATLPAQVSVLAPDVSSREVLPLHFRSYDSLARFDPIRVCSPASLSFLEHHLLSTNAVKMRFTPDGTALLVLFPSSLQVIDPRNGHLISRVMFDSIPESYSYALQTSLNGRYVYLESIYRDNDALVVDLGSGTVVYRRPGVRSLLSRDGMYLYFATTKGVYKRSITSESVLTVAQAQLEADAEMFSFVGPGSFVAVRSASTSSITVMNETTKQVEQQVTYPGLCIGHLEGGLNTPDLIITYPTSSIKNHFLLYATMDLTLLADLKDLPFSSVAATWYPSTSFEQGELFGAVNNTMGDIDAPGFVSISLATGVQRASFPLDLHYKNVSSVDCSSDGTWLAALCMSNEGETVVCVWKRP